MTITQEEQHHQQHHQQRLLSSPTNSRPGASELAIRHAGRAHIRGKIRRVWRPRFLEVLDSGLVRYYELPPTADIALPEDSDWAHVNMIPKDTLFILNARIVDVTTLRDLHVGLPKGSFGFLFRGQRQQVVSSPEMMATCGPPEPVMPRDFFCAVSTLMEAQTWVVALQWAASMCQARPSLSRANSGSYHGGSFGALSMQHNQLSQLPLPQSISMEDGSDVTSIDEPTFSATNGNSESVDRMSPAEPTSNAVSKIKTIVVTKVHKFRLVRLRSISFEVGFEIELLLLQQSSQKLTTVSERRILRTIHDLESLMKQLIKEVEQKSPTTVAVVKKLRKRLANLPQLSSSSERSSKLAITPKKTYSNKDFRESLSCVDGILRAISMDPIIVDSHAIKTCFSLTDGQNDLASNVHQNPPWWQCHNPQVVLHSRVTRPGSNVSIDQFVKDWLSQTTKYTDNDIPEWFMYIIQMQPWILAVIGVVIFSAIGPFWTLYKSYVATSVTIRLDVLILSWAIVSKLGHHYGITSVSQKPQQQQPQRAVARRSAARTSLRVPVPAPLARKPLAPIEIADSPSVANTQPINNVAEPLPINEVCNGLPDAEVDGSDAIDDGDSGAEEESITQTTDQLSSPLPLYPSNGGESCWSRTEDNIFRVRGNTYLDDKIKIPSGPAPFTCRGVDVWLTDNPPRHIARHPDVLGGKLGEANTFLVNFLLPFGNLVSYFSIPPLEEFPPKLRNVWQKFLKGDQQYRDARLKLLPIVVDGPWIVRAAVGNGTAPALLGKVIPLQYFFRDHDDNRKGVYEVDVIITASSIAKGILSVVKGHTKSLSIAFAFIIEAAEEEDLPETVLCSFQVHALHLEDCPHLPECDLDAIKE